MYKPEKYAIHIGKLLSKRALGTLTPAEETELDNWINLSKENKDLANKFSPGNDNSLFHHVPFDQFDSEKAFSEIEPALEVNNHTTISYFPLKRILAYAATVAVFAGIAVALWYYQTTDSESNKQPIAQQEIFNLTPGKSAASITLADGSTYNLDEQANEININANSISYQDGDVVTPLSTPTMVTIRTPKGGEYKVNLPDGSTVWLNAESTLIYPNNFSALQNRKVSLAGEAYFAVAHNEKAPFTVTSEQQEVTVLGTEFNLTAYANEPATKTTLIKGSVAVSAISSDGTPTKKITLRPNEQSTLKGSFLEKQHIDPAQSIAWRNGLFDFTGKDLKQILKELSRWYDFDVVYGDHVKNDVFYGKMYRDSSLSTIFEILKKSDVQFTMKSTATGGKTQYTLYVN